MQEKMLYLLSPSLRSLNFSVLCTIILLIILVFFNLEDTSVAQTFKETFCHPWEMFFGCFLLEGFFFIILFTFKKPNGVLLGSSQPTYMTS